MLTESTSLDREKRVDESTAWHQARQSGFHGYSMTAVIPFNRRTLLVALVALLHIALPWLAVMALLLASLRLFAVPIDSGVIAPAVVIGVTSLLYVEVPRPLGIMRGNGTHLPLASGVIAKWLGIALVLLVIFITTDVLEPVAGRPLWLWITLSPIVVAALLYAIHALRSRILVHSVAARRVVLVGYNDSSAALARRLRSNPDLFMNCLGFFDDRNDTRLGTRIGDRTLGTIDMLPQFVREHGVDVIFMSLPMRNVKRVTDVLEALHDTTVSIYYVPDVFVIDLIQSRAMEIDGVPVIAMRETPFHGYRMILKRLTDIVVSVVALVVLSPLLALAALSIRWTSPGPVLFKQRRYGLDGKEIHVYKFRTMRVMENSETVVQATRNDPRITAIGRMLRRTSMDELPQLFNVLQGSMSLVGPRPHAVAHNEQYRRLIRGYMVRHKALPGITGLAQVNGCRGETARLEDMERRVAFDLEYLRHWSPMLDLRILVMTVFSIWRDDKAY